MSSLRRIVKNVAYGLADALNVTGLCRKTRKDALTIVTYHSFGPAEEYPYLHRLAPGKLSAQLDHLGRHYDVVPLQEGLMRLERLQGAALDRPMVAITVDDGFADNYDYLFPALRTRGLPASIFVATDFLDTDRLPWPTRIDYLLRYARNRNVRAPIAVNLETVNAGVARRVLYRHFSRLSGFERQEALEALETAMAPQGPTQAPPLSWAQVREMQASGVSFGSHTRFHGWLDLLSPEEVGAELSYSRERIEAEAGECPMLAYPNGNWSADVVRAAAKAGYTYALTQDHGVSRAGGAPPLALPRIQVPHDETLSVFACRVAGVAL